MNFLKEQSPSDSVPETCMEVLTRKVDPRQTIGVKNLESFQNLEHHHVGHETKAG
jgi:hypothetical protein